MKVTKRFLVIWSAFLFLKANAQDYQNAVRFNALSPFFGTLNFSYERLINDNNGLQLTLSYTDFDSYGNTTNTNNSQNKFAGSGAYDFVDVRSQLTNGFSAIVDYKMIFSGSGFDGVYFAPFLRYSYFDYKRQLTINKDTSTSPQTSKYFSYEATDFHAHHTLGIGFVIGKQFTFLERLNVNVFAGPAYSLLLNSNYAINKTSDVVIGSGIPKSFIRGYGFRGGITIGFLL